MLSLLLISCTLVPQEKLVTQETPVTQETLVIQDTTSITPLSTATIYTNGSNNLPWWNDRVFYEIFVRSFYDSDGDGIGDIPGLTSQLDYLNDGNPETTDDLGITGIWLMPITQSPSYHGYDVIDYQQIEQDYGTNEDFKHFIEEAHKRDIKVIVDLVLNHTSNQHPWFLEAQSPGSAYADWYVWENNRPEYQGPWGQTVWHPLDNRYYYGVFWEGMPDLNYQAPGVTNEMYNTARIWLTDMQVDGFRLDAIKHLIEDGKIQENTLATRRWLLAFQQFVHMVSPDAILVGEIWSHSSDIAPYVNEAVDIAFEFNLADAMLNSVSQNNARALAPVQTQVLETYPPGQYAAFLSNHDQNRVSDQLPNDLGAAKVAATLLLTNPGVPFIYYGEEIGMSGTKPDERIRTPMQWDTTPDTAGFTTNNTPWQPLSAKFNPETTITSQTTNPDSLLSYYRRLIQFRQAHPALRQGKFLIVESDNRAVYSFLRYTPDETLLIIINLSKKPVEDYYLDLVEGPLLATAEIKVLFGDSDNQVTTPIFNNNGGFDNYTPLDILTPRSSLILAFEP